MSLFSDARNARIARARAVPESRKAFVRNVADLNNQIAILKEHVAALEKASRENPTDWGYAGSAAHLTETILHLNETFSK